MLLMRPSMVVLLVGLGMVAARGQARAMKAVEAVPDTVKQRVSRAFRAGDAERLLTPSADRVEVSLFGTRTFYSSAQALYVLREFFDTHPPADFILADATDAGDSFFLRGQFKHTRDNQPLQVYVRLVPYEDERWKLQEVRIDSGAE